MKYRPRSTIDAQISEEAAEWFIEFRSGDVDAAGRRAFEVWVRSSPEHLRVYLEHAAIWSEGDAVDARREIDVDSLIAHAGAERNIVCLQEAAGDAGACTGGIVQRYRRTAIAAAAALMIVGGAALFAYLRPLTEPVYRTDAGEQRSIRLPDGSTVELNSRSHLRVRFHKDGDRRVDLLEGQALFQVAKDAARPFVVHSGETRVRAVGTQFDVNRKRLGTVVTVIEGKVAVTSDRLDAGGGDDRKRPPEGADPVYLSAGEQLSLEPLVPAQPVEIDPATATAWTQRQLILKSALLSEVAEEFNRYSARRLTVDDRATEQLRLSGVFKTDPEFLIRYLRNRPDITVTESSAAIHIVHKDDP